jgi:dUTP pyrophosphatase
VAEALENHNGQMGTLGFMMKALAESISKVAIELGDTRAELLGRLYCLETEIESLSEVDIYVYQHLTPFRLAKAHAEDSCYDVFAAEDMIIPAGERGMVETGLVIGVDAHWEVLVRPRSGISANVAKGRVVERSYTDGDGKIVIYKDTEQFPKHLTIHLGTGDPGYRETYKVIVENGGSAYATIKKGDKIGQVAIRLKPKEERVIYVDKRSDIPELGTRGTDGFGSSGTNV